MKQSLLFALAVLCFQSLALGAARGVLESGYIYERRLVDSGALVFRSTATNQYAQQGQLLASTTWDDNDGDGVIDEIDTTAWTYDNGGRLLSYVQEFDFGPDDTIDWRGLTTFTNLSSDQTVEFSSVDWDGDGVVDYTLTSATTYDNQKNPLLNLQQFDFGLDGTIDATLVNTWTYEKDRILSHSEFDSDADGTPDSIENSIFHLNRRGQPISGETEIIDAHGTLTITSDYTYDKTGNLLQTTYDYFMPNAEGPPVHYRDTITGSYLPRNQLVSKLRPKNLQSLQLH